MHCHFIVSVLFGVRAHFKNCQKPFFVFFYSPIFFSPHLRSTTLPFCFFKCQVRVILFFIKKKLLLRGVSYRSTDAQSNSFNFQLRSRRWRSSSIYFSMNFGKKINFFFVSFFCLFLFALQLDLSDTPIKLRYQLVFH